MKILKPLRGKKCHREDYESYTHKECSYCKAIKPVGEFYKTKSKTKLGWSYKSYCIACSKKLCQEYGRNNRKKRNKRLRNWRKKSPKLAKQKDKRARYMKKYSITLEQLEGLKKANDYSCWICGKKNKRLVVDHDHKTSRVRGMLCDLCNKHLGYFENMNTSKIKNYLDQPCHADVLLEIANSDEV